jgi:CRISPR type I-A-associated protein Csa5
MSEGVTLYTPATGFPDLEAKIAFGLARIGIEAGFQIEVFLDKGFYQISLKGGDSQKINETFVLLASRLLSSSRLYDLGVKARRRSLYPTVDEKGRFKDRLRKIDLISLFSTIDKFELNVRREKMCGHSEIPKFGSPVGNETHSGGLILLASYHAGKPYWRDNRKAEFNLSLCEVCGYLATLGYLSFALRIQMGTGNNRKYIIALPLPRKALMDNDILKFFALQKTLYNFWLSDLIPLRDFVLGLLARTPSLAEFVKEIPLDFHLTLVSRDNRGDTVVEQSSITDTMPYAKFICASSYNVSTVEKLLGGAPKIASLNALTELFASSKKDGLTVFARFYTQETSTDTYINLLYPETSKYLLKEVTMIRPEVIGNKAVASLARTLRYFVRERKYQYADSLRNARKDSRDFEETVAMMLREGRLRLEQDKMIHLPTDQEVKEVFKLANENFEETKTALTILAFTFPSKEEEKEEITKEVPNA